jgi:methyl farnesoate epoxidase/farnesoate epoxidase
MIFNYTVAFILTLVSYIIYQKFTRRHLPPGPIPWPFIGSLVEVAMAGGRIPAEALHKLSKKYGNLYSITVGVVPTVVVCGNDMIRAAMKSENYDDRIDFDWVLDRSYGKKIGLIFSEGEFGRETRRLMMRILRDYGFGKKTTMESLILDEWEEFNAMLKEKVAKNPRVTIDCTFNGPMANIVWSLISGTRFRLDDPELRELLDAINGFARAGQVGGTSLLAAFPFLSKYFPELTGFNELHRIGIKLQIYLEKVVKDFRDRGTYKTAGASNFIEEFLVQIDKNKDTDTLGIYTDQNLVCCLNDLFFGGSETSANTTAHAIRLLVQYPEIQKKIREEIDQVVGRSRMVSYSDKPSLKYLEATLLEILRISNVAPIGARRAAHTYKFGEYTIPKGTSVAINYYSVHMDEAIWGDPKNFRPERFLDRKTGEIINSDIPIIFGVGKRNCIGEVTARTSLFIAIASLIQNFTFEVDPERGTPKDEDAPGFTVAPKPFTVVIKNRL